MINTRASEKVNVSGHWLIITKPFTSNRLMTTTIAPTPVAVIVKFTLSSNTSTTHMYTNSLKQHQVTKIVVVQVVILFSVLDVITMVFEAIIAYCCFNKTINVLKFLSQGLNNAKCYVCIKHYLPPRDDNPRLSITLDTVSHMGIQIHSMK